jgi:hypothetical protein
MHFWKKKEGIEGLLVKLSSVSNAKGAFLDGLLPDYSALLLYVL